MTTPSQRKLTPKKPASRAKKTIIPKAGPELSPSLSADDVASPPVVDSTTEITQTTALISDAHAVAPDSSSSESPSEAQGIPTPDDSFHKATLPEATFHEAHPTVLTPGDHSPSLQATPPLPPAPPAPQLPPPPPLAMETLHRMSHAGLLALAEERQLSLFRDSSRHYLALDLARDQLKRGGVLSAEGVIEFAPDAPMVRWPVFNFQPTPCDLVLPVSLLRQYELRPGLRVTGTVRMISERRLGLDTLTEIEGIPVAEWQSPTEFDKLTAMFPVSYTHLTLPTKRIV